MCRRWEGGREEGEQAHTPNTHMPKKGADGKDTTQITRETLNTYQEEVIGWPHAHRVSEIAIQRLGIMRRCVCSHAVLGGVG